MDITFTCNGCGQTLQVDERVAGQVVVCPQCGTSVMAAQTEWEEGATIGGFKLKQFLKETETGKVYLAEQLSLGRDVALKILSADFLGDSDRAAAFLEQLRATARLEHPHLVRVFSVGEDAGVYFVAMAHIEGNTLAERGAMTETEALDVAQKVGAALGWAWRHHHMIHGHIQPDKILLDRNGHPHVLDMGLAPWLALSNYSSPEQRAGVEDIGFRSDMFSLGVTLYQMLTGRLAFDAQQMLPDPRKFNPRISPGCVALLETLLAKQPSQRYASWDEFLSDAVRVRKGGKPLKASPGHGKSVLLRETTASSSARQISPSRSLAGLLGTLLLVAAAGVVAALFYTGRLKWPGTETPPKTPASVAPVAPKVPSVPVPPPRAIQTPSSATPPMAPVTPIEKPKETPPSEQPPPQPREEPPVTTPVQPPAVKEAMAKVRLDAELFAAQGRFDEAIKTAEGYNGPYATETAQERAALVERLKQDRDAAEALSRWKKHATTLAEMILRLDWASVRQEVAVVQKDTVMASLGPAQTVCEMALKVAALPEVMQASLQGDVGKTVSLATRSGMETGEIVSVAGGRIQLKKAVSGGTLLRDVRMTDLLLTEWLKRVGAEETTERRLMCGLLWWQARETDKAVELFERAEHPLGTLLRRVALEKALAKLAQDNPSSPVEFDVTMRGGMALTVKPNEQLNNLSALKGVPLKSLTLAGCKSLRDLSPLKGMPLEELDLSGTGVDTLEALRGMKLKRLVLRSTKVHDLSPLKGMPLEELALSYCMQVSDLSPLAGAPLKRLWLRNCRNVRDLTPLKNAPLERLVVVGCSADLTPVRGIPTLTTIVE